MTITPSDSWGGAGLLGVTIRLDDYGGADERLIRVLQVEPSSPAAICGLVEEKDYLLGTTADSFDSTSTLAQVLQRHVDKVVEVYVYNTDSDVVRVVALMPTYSWGGGGLLGAEVGTGYLHRLPAASRGTIGCSVERKVRMVGMKPMHPAEKDEGQQQQVQPQKQEMTLELEPQLEMEQEEGASHEDTHKTMQQVADHSVPNVTGSDGQQIPATNGSAPIAVQDSAKVVEQPSNDPIGESSNEGTNRDAGLFGSDRSSEETKAAVSKHQSVSEPSEALPTANGRDDRSGQQEAEPSAQSLPPPPADAAALFAAPPPAANTSYSAATGPTSFASQYMPPPPMSHLSRDPKDGDEVDLR